MTMKTMKYMQEHGYKKIHGVADIGVFRCEFIDSDRVAYLVQRWNGIQIWNTDDRDGLFHSADDAIERANQSA